MSESQDASVQSEAAQLLQKGIAAARVGDHEEAREYLRRVTELEEDNEEAWLWLSGIVEELDEKRACFERVLEINPENEQAQAGLEALERKQAAETTVEAETATQEEGVLYCANHPDRETVLRCNKCEKPICPQCAIRHPVGLRCQECAQLRRSPVYDVPLPTYALAAGVGIGASVVGAFVMRFVPGFFFVFFIAPFVGGLIAEAIGRATGYKRGLPLQIIAGASIVLGDLALTSGALFTRGGLAFVVANLDFVLTNLNFFYIILAGISAIARLR